MIVLNNILFYKEEILIMSLHDYFENTKGIGILATADKNGVVDTALYSRPHFVDEDNCIFLMADRRTHKNIQENAHASYIFIQESDQYQGKRLYLSKTQESEDKNLANELRRKKRSCQINEQCEDKKTFVVYFKVDTIRPLIGDGDREGHPR